MVKDFPFISNSSYYVFIDRIRSSKYYLSLMNSEIFNTNFKELWKKYSTKTRQTNRMFCSNELLVIIFKPLYGIIETQNTTWSLNLTQIWVKFVIPCLTLWK